MTKVLITGNTYPVKDQLKALGAKWDADQKAWAIDEDKAEQAHAIVANQKPQTPGICSKCGKPCKAPFTICLSCKPPPRVCRQCGARPNVRGWPRIYRNGICSDCYRSEREEAEMGY